MENGLKIMPSIVASRGEDLIVGEQAKSLSEKEPRNMVTNVKRFMGK